MNYPALINLYLGRNAISNIDYRLVNHSDGNGVQIEYWNITDKPQPTIAELEAFQPQIETQKILSMKITPREFVLGLMSLGVTKAQLEALFNQYEQAWAELTFATCVVRGNPLIDQLCFTFGVTSEQLDNLFLSLQKG